MLIPDTHTLTTYYEMGGFVMPPLIVVAVLLWYALAYRLLNIRTSTRNPRQLVELAKKKQLKSKSISGKAAIEAVELMEQGVTRDSLNLKIEERMRRLKSDINHHRMLVRTLVAVAPLLGLLGTVDGMIEVFKSLGDMALFTQTGGIAGGISRALFTTQMGLAISIPGLLIGRLIERRQRRVNRELDQIKDLVCMMRSPA